MTGSGFIEDDTYASLSIDIDNGQGEVEMSSTPDKRRKEYAKIDLTAMGINPAWTEELKDRGDNSAIAGSTSDFTSSGMYASVDSKRPLAENEAATSATVCSPSSSISPESTDSGIQDDSGIQYTHGPLTDEIYAVVQKKKPSTVQDKKDVSQEELPQGWERHEDQDGAYYWHIKSGRIQRDPPTPVEGQPTLSKATPSSDIDIPEATDYASDDNPLQAFEEQALKIAAESLLMMSLEPSIDSPESPSDPKQKAIRYAVRSLGWVAVEEGDLTAENSSKAVNKCIVDLSGGKRDINDAIGRWGDGKDLYMDITPKDLKLINPMDFTEMNSQSISSIRVWGVGRDNGRDFAYVARDRVSRKHMCHVFRCDTPARHIANTLRDICKQIIVERQQGNAARPTDLPNLNKNGNHGNQQQSIEQIIKGAAFPTPMEEPKKIAKCHYLGTAMVHRPTGIEVLNQAIERVYAKVPAEKWAFVDVVVAPSTITISEHKKSDNVLAECRVRFLSFIGISQTNVKMLGFIVHTAQDQFVCHVFHCEPSAGALSKTLQAACKLRFQKCLDSHGPSPEMKKDKPSKGIGAALKQGVHSVFSGISKGKKSK